MKYYAAFFINNYGFLQKKLRSFVDKTISEVRIYHKHQDIPFLSEKNLPKEVYPPEQWYIHGSYCGNKLINEKIPEIPLRKGTSLRKVEHLFEVISLSYTWTLLPWGSVYSDNMLSSFVFISKELKIFDKFMNSCPNVLDIKHYNNTFSRYNFLISSHKVEKSFSEVAKAIMIEDDFDHPGSSIWDACQLDTCPPLFISQLYSEDAINDFYEMSKADLESPFYWERANYKPLKIIDFHVPKESSDINSEIDKKFGVCQPQDRQSFIELCKLQRQDMETILFFPYNTDLDKLTKLLAKLEVLNHFEYSDLSYVNDILQATEWFFGVSRNTVDHSEYSLFISRDNKLIQKIDSFNSNYNSKLIAFF